MAATIRENFDDFNFMVILLFLYVILIGFIIMIMFNIKTKAKYNTQGSQSIQQIYPNNFPQTTQLQCIPKTTDGQC